ncbi:MAG: hypothetical protein Q7S52_04225 [bacterium]|nr:hypothetical protein [bacterium]
MFGIILVSIGTFFDEVSTLIGKTEVQNKKETIYSMAFLSIVWSTLWFLVIILIKGEFVFSAASLPTLLLRSLIEIALIYVGTLAVIQSDRSTFGFVRTGTIPLLLLADLWLGYTLTLSQIFGTIVIVLTLLVAFLNHGIRKEGIRFVLLATIFPVLTISLFKYNITHFNSVEAEQLITHIILLMYLFFMALKVGHENPLRMLLKHPFFVQSFAAGIGGVLISFAYLFAPASTITAAKRAVSVLWAVVSGNLYFQEKHIALKIGLFVVVAIGIALLAM